MSKVTVQDIEAVDDYWGPTFRSILEGDNTDLISEQLEQRIRSHDKDIERICNLYYQGFIDSIQELLHVRTQAKQLHEEVHALDRSLQQISASVLQQGQELVRARQIESNLASAIDALQACLPALECYIKFTQQASNKQYYQSLRTLETLETQHLVGLNNYRFATQIRQAIPVIKENIRHSAEADFREFLENIRKFSPKIGEVAITHTKKLQKRDINAIIAEHKLHGQQQNNREDENNLSAQDLIDFSPIYRCLHIYMVLGQREYFEKDYRQQRRDQSKLVLQPPPGMHDNLDAYKTYICAIVGFFIVEDHVKNTAGEVVTTSYLEDLWSTSLTKFVNEISMASSSCTDPNILLRIKNLIMLSINTFKCYGYTVNMLFECLHNMRDHYNEVLLQRWVHVFRDILDKEQFQPMIVESQEEYESIIERFPFHSDQLENAPFPKKFPFSRMVPEVYHQAKEFMYACMKFAEDLTLSPNEVAAMEIVANLRRLIEYFLDENFVTTNTVYFEKLITHLAAKDNAYILQAPFVLEWVDRCIDILCSDISKLNPKVISFAFNLFSLLTTNEWIIIEIKQRRLVDKVLDIVKSASHRFNPSIKLSIIRLLNAVCQYSMGLAYLGSMKIWQFIIEYCNQDHTLYVVREARRLLYDILYKYDVKTKDTALVKEILTEIIKPLTENVFTTHDDKIMVNVEDHELQHKLSSTLELLSFILQQTLESKEKSNIAAICRQEYDIPITVWKLTDMFYNESFIRKVLTMLSSFYFAQLLHDKWNGNQQIDPHSFNEFGVSIFNLMKFCISRNYLVSFLKVAEVNHKLWKKLGTRTPKEVYIENELVRYEPQLITFQLIPLNMIVRMNEFEEIFEKYLAKIFDLICEQTLRISYTYRDLLINMPIATHTDLAVKSINGVMSMVEILDREAAVIVSQACMYALREIIIKLYQNEHKLCQDIYFELDNLPSFSNIVEFENLIHTVLVSMQTLIQRFNITWKDSIETISLVNCLLQLLLANDLPMKVAVQSLKLLQLSIEHFLSPNMALLVDDLQGSGLTIMAPIIQKRSHDPNWEVRDSILELVISITTISHLKYPTFQTFLAENWICRIVYDMAQNDSEPYVRASALKCIAELVAIDGIYDGNLCKQNIPEYLIDVIYNESEGIVRKEAIRTLSQLNNLRKIPVRYKDYFYSIIAYSITNDLHWEVKVEAIKCLKRQVCLMLSDEGMIDGNFPSVTFSKEKRKIVQLTQKEVSLRIFKVLNELSQRGCLGVLLKCLREDCDVVVIQEAKSLMKKMACKLYQHEYLTSLNNDEKLTIHNNNANAEISPSTNSNEIYLNDHPSTSKDKDNFIGMQIENKTEEIVCSDAEILEFLDSDNIIESILNSQDINLLAETYKENLNINDLTEQTESMSTNSTKTNKQRPQIDPFYYKQFSNVSVNEYVTLVLATDFEEGFCEQDQWILCDDTFVSLLNEILCMVSSQLNSESVSADCY